MLPNVEGQHGQALVCFEAFRQKRYRAKSSSTALSMHRQEMVKHLAVVNAPTGGRRSVAEQQCQQSLAVSFAADPDKEIDGGQSPACNQQHGLGHIKETMLDECSGTSWMKINFGSS